jgi:electron transfer flavoprotein beta subunit
VLLGMKAMDGDQQQVGPMLAELLELPCVTVASSIELEGGAVVCHREIEGGIEVVEARCRPSSPSRRATSSRATRR